MAAPIVIIFGAGTQFYEKLACCFRAIPGRTHGSRASRRKSVKRPLATACCMAVYFIPAARGLGFNAAPCPVRCRKTGCRVFPRSKDKIQFYSRHRLRRFRQALRAWHAPRIRRNPLDRLKRLVHASRRMPAAPRGKANFLFRGKQRADVFRPEQRASCKQFGLSPMRHLFPPRRFNRFMRLRGSRDFRQRSIIAGFRARFIRLICRNNPYFWHVPCFYLSLNTKPFEYTGIFRMTPQCGYHSLSTGDSCRPMDPLFDRERP